MHQRPTVPRKPKSGLPLIARVLRHRVVQFAFSPLEAATRNVRLQADGTRVEVADALSYPLLDALFANRILGIHIPGWYDAALCDQIASSVLRSQTDNWNVYDVKEGYRKSDVEVVGKPFNMAILDERKWHRYFTEMREVADQIRSLSGMASGPLDRFRLEMDEVWPDGLMIRNFKGAKMTPGLVRVMNEESIVRRDIPLNCHVDESPLLSSRSGLFSVNVYLKPATHGGELFLWNTRMEGVTSIFRYWYIAKNFFLNSSYADEELQRQFQSRLPSPFQIKVGKGDLVILNTGRPHAVAPFSGGPRVSMQAFLTYRRNKPLGVWA